MDFLAYSVVAVVAYLLGSIPTGFLVAKARGVDIRTVGSGNIGATNAMRVLGKPAGITVLVIDGLKGFAACTWACDVVLNLFGIPLPDATSESYRIVAGITAVLGHCFTCWLKFKGGKGIATSAGVFFALATWAAIIALATWILTAAIFRYASVASIAASVALPAAVWLTKENLFLRIVTIALGALAIYKHRGNVQRLMKGTEGRLGAKPMATEEAK